MTEADLSKKVKKWLTDQRIYHFKKPQGKFVTRKGIADYILCVKGKFIALELKSSTGRLSKAQKNERVMVMHAEGTYIEANPENWELVKLRLKEVA